VVLKQARARERVDNPTCRKRRDGWRKGSIASMPGQLFYALGDVAVKARHVAEER
jgi:hypothetical protein